MLAAADVKKAFERISACLYCLQVTKYVLREILNHRSLVHPHIVQFKEASYLSHDLGNLEQHNARDDMS